MISRTALHGIRALASLAARPRGEFVGASLLARETDAPANYLGKLLQVMARQGLVESRKGLGGGFRLARAPREISLLEVAEPIDHLSRWHGCVLGRPACSDDAPCAVHSDWAALRDAYLSLLERTTIADIVHGPGVHGPGDPGREPHERKDR